MEIKKVVVAGGGILGSQIALQCQYSGFDTTIWLRSDSSIERCKPRLERFKKDYRKALDKMNETKSPADFCAGLADSYETFDYEKSVKNLEEAYDNLKLETNMQEAFSDCDLVIESMSENLEDKKAFYQKMAPYLPEKTIICTNSSSLLPSDFMKDTGRPEKFMALHFANRIHKFNTGEVMKTSKTRDDVFDKVVEFTKDIRMVPLKVKKEKAGYLLNSLLIPFLTSAIDLVVEGVASPEDVDRAWTISTGAPSGPFDIYDMVGISTPYEMNKAKAANQDENSPYNYKKIAELFGKMIEDNKLGIQTGEGFYKYDKDGKKIK